MQITLILTCAGKGLRAGFNKNKLLVPVPADGRTCFEITLDAFCGSGLFDRVIVTAAPCDIDEITALARGRAEIVAGGATRTQSVRNALSLVADGIVLIHDGARPFADKKLISDCIACAEKYGSAIPAVPISDSVVRAENRTAASYVGKDGLYRIQTPQGFRAEDIKTAYGQIKDEIFPDDGAVYARYIAPPRLFTGSPENVKLTFKDDFNLFFPPQEVRFGTGFDCHRLTGGRALILGGIAIPHEKGLDGHSDADVLTHAVMDAILSACAMRDIGYHFSDKDPQYKDISSMVLLSRVLNMIKAEGFAVTNVSAVIMAEKPKLSPYIPAVTANIAAALGLFPEKVGISATTLEGLGFVGREEGICVNATAAVIKNAPSSDK